jgi:cytochrome P450
VLHGYFNPKAMEMWRPMVVDAIKVLLDEAEEKGWMDVMSDFATPLPLLVIAQMLGMPNQDRQFIRELAEKLLFIGRGEVDRMKPLTEGIQELQEYLGPIVAERLAKPGDDLLSVLAHGEKIGVYNRDQVVANAILLLLAGHETTINLICNGTRAFIDHPEQWRLFKQNPAQLMKPATEECLRYESPVKSIQRIAAVDVEMRGKVLKKDERIRWFITAANRDPEKFPEPETFDINRYPNLHVAFGSGIHHCLGATLARLEGQEAFRALAERFESLHIKK